MPISTKIRKGMQTAMNLRLANRNDLPQLKAVYEKIVDNMNKNNVRIWNEIYPYEAFSDDIENHRLYLLVENDEIAASFALCSSNAGEAYVKWEKSRCKALYIDRFGVNVNYLRRGMGSLMLGKAIALASEKGAEYIRLFVVDINEPAIKLYIKNGFVKADGIYDEIIHEGFVLHELGFEMKL